MMNEINALIWPSPDGIGALPTATWDKTVEIMTDAGPAHRTARPRTPTAPTWPMRPARSVTGDAVGADFVKGTVEVTPKGE